VNGSTRGLGGISRGSYLEDPSGVNVEPSTDLREGIQVRKEPSLDTGEGRVTNPYLLCNLPDSAFSSLIEKFQAKGLDGHGTHGCLIGETMVDAASGGL